jgi:hypothetical protein
MKGLLERLSNYEKWIPVIDYQLLASYGFRSQKNIISAKRFNTELLLKSHPKVNKTPPKTHKTIHTEDSLPRSEAIPLPLSESTNIGDPLTVDVDPMPHTDDRSMSTFADSQPETDTTILLPELESMDGEERGAYLKNLFQTFSYTYSTYLDYDFPFLSDNDIKPHIYKVQQSIAKMASGYIIELQDNNCIKYKVATDYEARYFLEFSIEIHHKIVTKKMIEGKVIKESKTLTKNYSINRSLTSTKTTSNFAFFEAYDLISNNPRVLQLWKLPEGNFSSNLILKIIHRFEERIYNPGALQELLASHSYRLRNPSAFTSKLFIS